MILEIIPDSTITIQTADESIFVYKMSEVDRIEKDTVAVPVRRAGSYPVPRSAAAYTAVPYDERREIKRGTFSIFGGAAFPTGDFDDEDNGCAKIGYCIGAQYVSSGQIGFLVNMSYISNPAQLSAEIISSYNAQGSSGNWITIPVLCGLKIGTTNPEGVNLFFAPVIGFCVSSSPEMRFTVNQSGYYVSSVETVLESGTTVAVAYGAEFEFNLGPINIGACYVASKPEYESHVSINSSSPASYDHKFKQSIWILQLYMGIAF